MKDRYRLLIPLGIFELAYFIPFASIQEQKAIRNWFHMLPEFGSRCFFAS